MKPMGRPDPGSGVNLKDGRMRRGRPAVMLVGSRYASDLEYKKKGTWHEPAFSDSGLWRRGANSPRTIQDRFKSPQESKATPRQRGGDSDSPRHRRRGGTERGAFLGVGITE